MHFAGLVITKDKPTKDVLARALAPWGPQAGNNAKWDWHALGGRYRGMLNATCTSNFVTGDPEYPNDEPGLQPRHDPRGGVDALQKRNQYSFSAYVPRVIVFDGRWHETPPFAWRNQVKDHGCPFLSDVDPAAPLLQDEEGAARAMRWWHCFYEIVEGVPDEYWMSIVDYRAPRPSSAGHARSDRHEEGHVYGPSLGGLVA
jgi:hypothetical protein